jgi:hypothetical protein
MLFNNTRCQYLRDGYLHLSGPVLTCMWVCVAARAPDNGIALPFGDRSSIATHIPVCIWEVLKDA